jgi:AraC-like DNA-binding protein
MSERAACRKHDVGVYKTWKSQRLAGNWRSTTLLHSSLELNETAYLLGYEDSNSFFRAFHQWEGTSPGEWRAGHGKPSNVSRTALAQI